MKPQTSRFRYWLGALFGAFMVTFIFSVWTLMVVARHESNAVRSGEKDTVAISTPGILVWGMGLTLFVIGPIVVTIFAHGRQSFVAKYNEQWRETERLKDLIKEYRRTFGGRSVDEVMESLRENRLEALREVRRASEARPDAMGYESAKEYRSNIHRALSRVAMFEEAIEQACVLLGHFHIPVSTPVSYFRPKEVPEQLTHDVTILKIHEAEDVGAVPETPESAIDPFDVAGDSRQGVEGRNEPPGE